MTAEVAIVVEFPDTPEQLFNYQKREQLKARMARAALRLEQAGRVAEGYVVRMRAIHAMNKKYPPLLTTRPKHSA